jgi:hypothetical protein
MHVFSLYNMTACHHSGSIGLILDPDTLEFPIQKYRLFHNKISSLPFILEYTIYEIINSRLS